MNASKILCRKGGYQQNIGVFMKFLIIRCLDGVFANTKALKSANYGKLLESKEKKVFRFRINFTFYKAIVHRLA